MAFDLGSSAQDLESLACQCGNCSVCTQLQSDVDWLNGPNATYNGNLQTQPEPQYTFFGTQTLDNYYPPIEQPWPQDSAYISRHLQTLQHIDLHNHGSPTGIQRTAQTPVAYSPLGGHGSLDLNRQPVARRANHNPQTLQSRTSVNGNAARGNDIDRSRKRQRPANSTDDVAQLTQPKSRKLFSVTDHLQLTADQEELLEVKLKQWQKNCHVPTEQELKKIAAASEVSFFKVTLWYGAKLSFEQGPAPSTPVPSDPVSEPGVSELSAAIARYIKNAAGKSCKAGKTVGKYPCSWPDCGYSTDSRYDWERHEESKQPQNFWVCKLCRDSDRTPFITHRADKLFPHIHSIHPADEGNKDQIRTDSKVPYAAPFPSKCTFRQPSTNSECGHIADSWKQRNDHWLSHFDDEAASESNACTSQKVEGDVESDAAADNRQRSRESSIATTGSLAVGQSHSNGNQRNLPNDRISDGLDAALAHDAKTFRLQMIDVSKHEVVLTTSDVGFADVRFLALEYDAMQLQASSKEVLHRLTGKTLRLPALEGIADILKAAIELAHEMGFQYLWTALTNENSTISPDAIQRMATLIAVMGFRKNEKQQIWHFTCDHSQLPSVRAWVHERNWFRHVTHLGQGAYGFVDHVETAKPRATKAAFARKIVLRDRTSKSQRARFLVEIDTMQKLDHPYIAKFVAAYCDRTAFNILMSPVAETDLRQYLARPQDFPGRSSYLPQWFRSLAEALDHMHSRSVRHKDIKPANVLISGNDVLFTDFGTSLQFSAASRAGISQSTGPGFLTPQYSAPEVMAQSSRGRAADVFSLGCVFAEMLAVGCGQSVEQMHADIGLASREDGRPIVELADDETEAESPRSLAQLSPEQAGAYSERIPQLLTWLWHIKTEHTRLWQQRSIHITEQMLCLDSEQRPDASRVVQSLSVSGPCLGLGLDVGDTCYCCPTELGTYYGDLRYNSPWESKLWEDLISDKVLASDFSEPGLGTFHLGPNSTIPPSAELRHQFEQQCQQNGAYDPQDTPLASVHHAEGAGESAEMRAFKRRLDRQYQEALKRGPQNAEDIWRANVIRGMMKRTGGVPKKSVKAH